MTDSDGPGTASQVLSEATLEATLRLLLDRIDHVDRTVGRLESAIKQVPDLAATAIDTLDDLARRGNEHGIRIDERADRALRMLERLTDEKTFEALEMIVAHAPELASTIKKLNGIPDAIAMITDILDDHAARLSDQGIDLQRSLRQGLHAALWLGDRVSESELDRLGILLRSDVLEPHALEVVGKTGYALATSHEAACQNRGPDRIGPFGLLRALADPRIQRSLAFLTQVARCFGENLDQSSIAPAPRNKKNINPI